MTPPTDRPRLGAADSAAVVTAQLDAAGQLDPAAARATELDHELVAALRESVHTDAILQAVPLAALAALVDRAIARLGDDPAPPADRRTALWDVLDLARRPAVLRRIPRDATAEWADRFLEAIERSQLTVGHLFRHRAQTYAAKTLFELPASSAAPSLTWHEVAGRIELLARGLIHLGGTSTPTPIAVLSENRLEMALLDLACLTSGLPNVMVPANSTDADVGYILRHARVRTVVLSGREQLHKVLRNRADLPDLAHIVSMDEVQEPGVVTLTEVQAGAKNVAPAVLAELRDAVRIDDRATVMYTSGTTGVPKGIQFSQRNLVFKRFARALALPEIGDADVFLSYLPLFHTFGRYLEMLGCVFWGAKYCFLLDPSVDALLDSMRRYRPSVFISVPRKWIQLYEAITQHADPMVASEDELHKTTATVTGGRLRWGLSAAGHLDAEVFRFFQHQGVHLHSGFGMSEATGGITMTPTDEYKDNSLGVPLPGIETKLAEDGELLIRGAYVMIGYLDPPEGERSFTDDGWLHTGDVMVVDADGHMRLVDRKKEIYKNIKGQTVAPQRLENLFREFESVGRAFLVGDHRPYNTLLIYPNPSYAELDFATLPDDEIRDHFRSLIVSVNRFVAPFERIVDFTVIDRDLDADRGELTPKGTPRRNVVVEHFTDVIDAMYRRSSFTVGGIALTLPNWLFQTLGITAQDVRVDGDAIELPSVGGRVTVRALGPGRVQIGAFEYRYERRTLDLGSFLTTPDLWLGNESLVAFAPLDLQARERYGRHQRGLDWTARCAPYVVRDTDAAELADALAQREWHLGHLHVAACLLAAPNDEIALEATRLLGRILSKDEGAVSDPARAVLVRAAESPSSDVRRRAFQLLVPSERIGRFPDMVRQFLATDPTLLDTETTAFLCERRLPEAKIQAFIQFAAQVCGHDGHPAVEQLGPALLGFLAEYGAAHPSRFRATRVFLVRMSLFGTTPAVRRFAADARDTLEFGFRQWLGPTARIAVDTETGQEYQWDDVVVFEESTDEEDRDRLLTAIRTTTFLREAIFLFYRGTMIRLNDIPPGGIWIRLIGDRHGKRVYRITVQTRTLDTYDIAANINESLSDDAIHEEVDWLILCGEAEGGVPVVESYGGYHHDHDLWSEEFIPGDTLDRELARLKRRAGHDEGLVDLWPFLAWSALSAYVDFWVRTSRTQEIAQLHPADIVLPTHDYHIGSRIVSLSARQPHESLMAMTRRFMQEFVVAVESQYEEIQGDVGWDVVFSSVLEVLGETDGLDGYRAALADAADVPPEVADALRSYIAGVEARGFLPMRLYFAAKRYRRWASLNEDATAAARAATLQELAETYGLDRLARSYPEARLRFFRETVFRGASAELAGGLDELIAGMRARTVRSEDLASAVAELRQRLSVAPDDDYFLARIPFAYLRPEDAVDFVSIDLGGGARSEIVVALEDVDGEMFRVRHVLLPKEVERLHRLFQSAKLDVRFRPEHRYLVAINAREQIIGGIFYEIQDGGESAHLEKIVVAEGYRRKGVADGLMREFFNRVRAAGATRVTTGFFRPEYFYSYGFTIERRYAGLVKELGAEPADGRAGESAARRPSAGRAGEA
jgi:long-subunit acyl-CoA synthetase (AMP-forming)/GNAT superfamily N-acetyltransferase